MSNFSCRSNTLLLVIKSCYTWVYVNHFILHNALLYQTNFYMFYTNRYLLSKYKLHVIRIKIYFLLCKCVLYTYMHDLLCVCLKNRQGKKERERKCVCGFVSGYLFYSQFFDKKRLALYCTNTLSLHISTVLLIAQDQRLSAFRYDATSSKFSANIFNHNTTK